MDIKPIRTDADHAEAVQEIERLWNAKPGTPEHDRLDVLGTLVDAYEATRWPIDPPDPVETIKFRMEQGGFSRTDLGKVIGSRSRASQILARKRRLTTEMIWAISRAWNIPAENLVRPYDLSR